MEFIELLQFPFLQRALVTGVLLALLLSLLGVFASLRGMAFFSEGIAHASLAGIAIAILAGVAPLPIALLWGVLVALGLFVLERRSVLSSDSLIGIFFTSSMALGVILMSLTQGYQPELLSFLFGSILTTNVTDLWVTLLATVLILAWLVPTLPQMTFLCLSEELAQVRGVKTQRQLLLFYVSLAVSTVLAVKLLGIILVSALFILPSATARFFATTFAGYVRWSVVVALVQVLLGIVFSLLFDLPTGATIVLTGTGLFLLGWMTSLSR